MYQHSSSSDKRKKMLSHTLLLRLAVSTILIWHSIPGMFNNGIYAFGKYYLDETGFAPYGVYLAWAIKLSHVVCAVCFLLNRFIRLASFITIAILVMGIVLVHFKEGWYVVGGGRNGIEFNFLLIFVLLTLIFPDGLHKSGNSSKD